MRQFLHIALHVIIVSSFVYAAEEAVEWHVSGATYGENLPAGTEFLKKNAYWKNIKSQPVAERNNALRAVLSWRASWDKKRYHIAAALAARADPNLLFSPVSDLHERAHGTKHSVPTVYYEKDCLLSLAIRHNDMQLYERLRADGAQHEPCIEDYEDFCFPLGQALELGGSGGSFFLNDILRSGVNPDKPLSVHWFGRTTKIRPLFLARTLDAVVALVAAGAELSHKTHIHGHTWSLSDVYAHSCQAEPALLRWCIEQGMFVDQPDANGKAPLGRLLDILKEFDRERSVTCCGCTDHVNPVAGVIVEKISILVDHVGVTVAEKEKMQSIVSCEQRDRKGLSAKTWSDRGFFAMLSGLAACFLASVSESIVCSTASSVAVPPVALACGGAACCLGGGCCCLQQGAHKRWDRLPEIIKRARVNPAPLNSVSCSYPAQVAKQAARILPLEPPLAGGLCLALAGPSGQKGAE